MMNQIKKDLGKKLTSYRKERGLEMYPQLRMNNQQMKNYTATINGGPFTSREAAQDVIEYLDAVVAIYAPLTSIEPSSQGAGTYQIRYHFSQEV